MFRSIDWLFGWLVAGEPGGLRDGGLPERVARVVSGGLHGHRPGTEGGCALRQHPLGSRRQRGHCRRQPAEWRGHLQRTHCHAVTG